jgi:hypothetical protein
MIIIDNICALFHLIKVIKPLLGMVTMDVYGLLPHENEGIGYQLDGLFRTI